MENYSKGIFTIATGQKRFILLAKNLAKSIRLTNPSWPIALLTDSDEDQLDTYFDYVIPFREDIPSGFIHKLFMYDYSPFEETLFIDADSLVIAPLDDLFDKMKVSEVSAQGFKFTDRVWAGVHASSVMRFTGAKYLIMHNGGIYYFKKSPISKRVFEKAKVLLDDYDDIGFYKLRGKYAHEPLMSTAMSLYEMNAFDDEGKGMRTFVDISSKLSINVLEEKCTFYEFLKEHRRQVNPIIIHFCGAYANWFHYKRESLKLNIYFTNRWIPKPVINILINLCFNPPYLFFIFNYRMIKALMGRSNFKIFPLLPTLRYK